jgi:hypothetical protein
MKNLLFLAACAGLLGGTARLAAEPAAPTVSAQVSLGDTLKLAQANDLPVIVNVDGGVSYNARVKDVGSAAVVLTKVYGKEFYDVYVPLGQVTSVELRIRTK